MNAACKPQMARKSTSCTLLIIKCGSGIEVEFNICLAGKVTSSKSKLNY